MVNIAVLSLDDFKAIMWEAYSSATDDMRQILGEVATDVSMLKEETKSLRN